MTTTDGGEMVNKYAENVAWVAFVKAVYPETPNLALTYDEETVVKRATELLLRQGLFERIIREIEGWTEGQLGIRYYDNVKDGVDAAPVITTQGRERLRKALDDWQNEYR